MKKGLLRLLVLMLGAPAALSADDHAGCPRDFSVLARPLPAASPGLEELEEKVWAIHAHRGTLKGDAIHCSLDYEPSVNVANPRPTVHWTLGEMVRPHDRYSWDQMKIAVMTPLRNLNDQIINLNTYDTITLGPHSLTSKDVVIVPEGLRGTLRTKAKLEFYDDSKMGLRDAVEAFQAREGHWTFRMENTAAKEGTADFQGTNANTTGFFKSYLDAHPHVSFGDALSSKKGEMWRMGMLDANMIEITRGFTKYGSPYNADAYHRFLALLRHNARKMDEIFAGEAIPRNLQDSYRAYRREIDAWINLAEIEERLLRERKFSIQKSSEEVRGRFIKLRHDRAAMEALATQLAGERKLGDTSSYYNGYGSGMAGYFNDFLRWLPEAERRELIGL